MVGVVRISFRKEYKMGFFASFVRETRATTTTRVRLMAKSTVENNFNSDSSSSSSTFTLLFFLLSPCRQRRLTWAMSETRAPAKPTNNQQTASFSPFSHLLLLLLPPGISSANIFFSVPSLFSSFSCSFLFFSLLSYAILPLSSPAQGVYSQHLFYLSRPY